MKILMTGGHVTPALAVIDTLLTKKVKRDEIIFVGRKHSLDHEKNISFEFKEVQKRKLIFIPIKTGKLSRILSLSGITNLLNIPLGFITAYIIIKRNKPNIIMSFGSYIAVPICFWAYIFRIPIITHEQTLRPGLANTMIGKWATKIFVAFPETAKFFAKKKVSVTGNPIRASIYHTQDKQYGLDPHKPTIYVTGGNLGAHSINVKIKQLLPTLLQNFNIIHQTGESKEYKDYEELQRVTESLPEQLQKRYMIKKHVFDDEIGSIFACCDFVIARSGANTFFELIALQKPAILIPLPWSARDEQLKHAELFKKKGFGELHKQHDSTSQLLELILTMNAHLDMYKASYQKLHSFYTQNAAQTIAENLITMGKK
jgi:UDP-N-acetylglucosamine--N-acetylmuramyl-(pentapeptide) pyrophosphoryl-undecaprenol N-acetylglucosamine transferase